MNVTDWIAFGALAVAAIGPAAQTLRAGGRRDGKLDQILTDLKEITKDHEDRLRKGGL